VLIALIKAYEIQGVLALANSFNRIGLDHVILVKVASTAVAAHLLGATEEQIQAAVSQAWVDGHSLRTYRQAPNTTSRKSWAAGDATSRAVRLALMTLQGEPGLPRALSAPKWGFNEVVYKGQRLQFVRPFGNYVMDNILFKISFPAEFHAQTAVEGALQLHDQVKDRLDQIERIELWTQEPALRIISKTGPLHNPADRDHCLQYMVAVPLIYGYLTADCYEDGFAGDPRLDDLRARMTVAEESQFTRDYYDPEMRAIGNSIQVFFKDGTSTKKVTIAYPLGHPRRRPEGLPLLERKFQNALAACFAPDQAEKISRLFQEPRKLETTPVHEFMDLLVLGGT
jgi:2-methylcitrate dehydratase